MLPFPPSLLLGALAAAVFGAAVALALLVARAARRGQRQARLRQVHLLSRAIANLFDGVCSPRALRHIAARTDEAAFWSALEVFAVPPDHDPRALARALARDPRVAAERRALRDDSPWSRELAARRLARLPSPATRRALRGALVRGPELVSYAAARALANARDLGTLRWLLAHPGALGHRPAAARATLLRSFGRRGLALVAAALERGTPDPRHERALVEALGLGRHAAARAAVEARLLQPDLDLRAAAARTLGRLGDPAATPALIRALEDAAWPVRAQAARGLGTLGDAGAVPALAARLTDRAWWVRRHAAYALASLGDAGRSALRSVAADSTDTYAREMAQEALGPRAGAAGGC